MKNKTYGNSVVYLKDNKAHIQVNKWLHVERLEYVADS